MVDEFIREVQTIVGPFLSDLGFTVDGVDDAVDEGGPGGSALYYRGPDCKIQIYHSSRESEINAMIAPLDTQNNYGSYERSGKWHYFNDFVEIPDLPLEDLVRKLREERANSETLPGRLEWLKKEHIAKYCASAHAAIVTKQ